MYYSIVEIGLSRFPVGVVMQLMVKSKGVQAARYQP